MSDVVHITDHAERARARLLGQYQGKPRLQVWIDAFSTQIQELEDVFFDLYLKRFLATAEGVQLDNIGEIVGYKRAGSDDDEYRQLLAARIRVNLSSGKLEQLILILRLILVGHQVIARDYIPAALELEVNDVTLSARRISNDFLQRAKAGGIRLRFIYSKETASDTLRFGSVYGGVTLTATQRPGSVHTTGTGGGKIAGVMG